MIAKDLYQGQAGKLLKKHLEITVDQLDKVSDIKETDPMLIAVNVLARQKAIEVMNQILLLTSEEKKSDLPTKKKNQYGL